MFPHPIEAVIFDMDGTLHDTEGVYQLALRRSVADVGFVVSDSFCHSLIGVPGREADALLRQHLGPSFPFDACDQLYIRHRDALLAGGVALKPGVTALLDHLADLQLPIAIATSASRRLAEEHLNRSGLIERFSVLVTRDDVKRGKPSPDLFLRAAALVGVQPRHCLAIEDSANGIRAASAAGMMPVMVPDLLEPSDDIRAACVGVVADLHEVMTLLPRS